MGELEREMVRRQHIGCADWIMTCKELCRYTKLSLRPDAAFTAAHRQRAVGCANIRTCLQWIKQED